MKSILLNKKWQLSTSKLTILLSIYFTFILNFPFIKKVFNIYQPIGTFHDYFIYTIPLVLFAGCCFLFNLLLIPFIHKILIPLLIIISAAIGYNILFFNVYFDKNMLTNVLQTTPAETMRMISTSYVLWLVILGLLPTLIYLLINLRYQIWWREILNRITIIVSSLLIVIAVGSVFYQDYASFFRNHNNLKHIILPSNFIAASFSKIKKMHTANIPYQALGKGAKLIQPDDGNHHVLIIVVGETTRAQNWGLNGYSHQTTPKLAARIKNGEYLINFPNVHSCGTATALSVPCMFSSLTRENYEDIIAKRQDNLLDTLQTAGMNVHWLENNSDCKGVCHAIPTVNTIVKNLPEYCTDGECLDNIMLPEVDNILKNNNASQNLVIVLHTIGSHGPTYFERYTKNERIFTPTCDTKQINRCTNEQLINTYDNSILYLDQFLDKLINKLDNHPNWESALYYVSDHGESLGENGIYLHGTPYPIAPKEQISVPMIMWFSPTWAKNKPYDLTCLQKIAQQPYSHDNLFHTALSMTNIQLNSVKQYEAKLDILANCQKNNH